MARFESIFGYQPLPAVILAQKYKKTPKRKGRRGPMGAYKNVWSKVKNGENENEITIVAGRTGYVLRPREWDGDRRRRVDEKG